MTPISFRMQRKILEIMTLVVHATNKCLYSTLRSNIETATNTLRNNNGSLQHDTCTCFPYAIPEQSIALAAKVRQVYKRQTVNLLQKYIKRLIVYIQHKGLTSKSHSNKTIIWSAIAELEYLSSSPT